MTTALVTYPRKIRPGGQDVTIEILMPRKITKSHIDRFIVGLDYARRRDIAHPHDIIVGPRRLSSVQDASSLANELASRIRDELHIDAEVQSR